MPHLPASPQDRAALGRLITDHLPAADTGRILTLLDQMGEGDLTEVFAAVSKEARRACKPIVDMLELRIVACSEDFPFKTRETMQQMLDGLKFGFLAQSDSVEHGICDLCTYIPSLRPFPGFHAAVQSAIPTLVL